jgi:hypothetical protein
MKFLDDTKVYLNDAERDKVVWELLAYSRMIYSKVYVFVNYEKFCESFTERDKKGNPPKEYWEGLHYEKLIDHFKICTVFENYNKAILLSKGYMVHTIDDKKNKRLAKTQREEPVLISDFKMNNSFIKDNFSSKYYLEGLKNFNTISFGLTLKEDYQNVINLDHDFVTYLKKINTRRNRLHFYKNYSGGFSVAHYLEQLKYAMDYGNKMIDKRLKVSHDNLH